METNPYQSPEAELKPSSVNSTDQRKNDSPLKYVVAIVGAVIVFTGTLIALLLITIAVAHQIFGNFYGVIIAYPLAMLLAIFAAYQSFRATLKNYQRK